MVSSVWHLNRLEILRAGFKYGFLNDEALWLQMLKDRNLATHIYDEEAFNAAQERVYTSYIVLLESFKIVMESKISALETSADSRL